MLKTSRYIISAVAVLTASISGAVAGGAVPLPVPLSSPLQAALPFAEGGLLGLAAAGVIGGVWLARRKRR